MIQTSGHPGAATTRPAPVALATPLAAATQAGLRVADDGGNALDAALAAAAFLTVAYTHNCAIGGDLLALVREPDGTTTFINASGRSLAATDADQVRRDHAIMPLRGAHTVTVPGMVSGWAALHARGAALPWSSHLTQAIEAAEQGVPVSAGLAAALGEDWPVLVQSPGFCEVFGRQGAPFRGGEQLRQPALTQTLRTLAEHGPDAFYRGSIAEQLTAGLQQLGVPMTMNDLSTHAASEEPPLEVALGDWTVTSAPPNSQGFVVLRLLGIFGLRARATPGGLLKAIPETALAHAFLRTAEERDRNLADPRAMTIDVRQLLSPQALNELLESSLTSAAQPAIQPESAGQMQRQRPDGDTVAVVAADAEGRSVSLIQSVYHSFGSQILEPATGIVLHNRGASFSLDAAAPNCLAPDKRPAHTLTPLLAEKEGERLVVGSMGGEVQPQVLLQVLARLLDGERPQAAVAGPRWTVGPWDRGTPTNTLNWEADLPPETVAAFDDWVGPLNPLPPRSGQVGHAQAIRARGAELESGTDPRADGLPRT